MPLLRQESRDQMAEPQSPPHHSGVRINGGRHSATIVFISGLGETLNSGIP